MSFCPQPKGPTRKQIKAAGQRVKAAIYKVICGEVDLRDKGRCRHCELWVGEGHRHHHHIVYRSQGGEDTMENLILLCQKCHQAVHDHRLLILSPEMEMPLDANGQVRFETAA